MRRTRRTQAETWRFDLDAHKRKVIRAALRRTRGNRTHAAQLLGLQRTYLLRTMRQLSID